MDKSLTDESASALHVGTCLAGSVSDVMKHDVSPGRYHPPGFDQMAAE